MLASNDRLSHLQPLQDITATQLDQMLAVNLRAPFLLAQRAAGSMREPGSSRILLIFRAAAFTGGVAGPHHARPRPGCTQLTHFLPPGSPQPGSRSTRWRRRWPPRPGCCPATRPSCAAGAGRPSQVAGLAAAILARAYLTNQVISPTAASAPDRHRTVFTTGRRPWRGSR